MKQWDKKLQDWKKRREMVFNMTKEYSRNEIARKLKITPQAVAKIILKYKNQHAEFSTS